MIKTFEIKSSQLSLISFIVKKNDLKAVALELLQNYGTFGDKSNFFDYDGIIIDCTRNQIQFSKDDLQVLMQAMLDCRLQPVAFRQKSEAENQLALALGLVLATPEMALKKTAIDVKKAVDSPAGTSAVISQTVSAVPFQSAVDMTLMIDRPIRSGQKVYARGADLVLLAMVNPGAEIAADGHVHVYAPLRGKVMAGANGNLHARIFSTCLEPELISIAGVYRTSEFPLPAEIQGQAAQVFLSNDGQEKLVFRPLKN